MFTVKNVYMLSENLRLQIFRDIQQGTHWRLPSQYGQVSPGEVGEREQESDSVPISVVHQAASIIVTCSHAILVNSNTKSIVDQNCKESCIIKNSSSNLCPKSCCCSH